MTAGFDMSQVRAAAKFINDVSAMARPQAPVAYGISEATHADWLAWSREIAREQYHCPVKDHRLGWWARLDHAPGGPAIKYAIIWGGLIVGGILLFRLITWMA